MVSSEQPSRLDGLTPKKYQEADDLSDQDVDNDIDHSENDGGDDKEVSEFSEGVGDSDDSESSSPLPPSPAKTRSSRKRQRVGGEEQIQQRGSSELNDNDEINTNLKPKGMMKTRRRESGQRLQAQREDWSDNAEDISGSNKEQNKDATTTAELLHSTIDGDAGGGNKKPKLCKISDTQVAVEENKVEDHSTFRKVDDSGREGGGDQHGDPGALSNIQARSNEMENRISLKDPEISANTDGMTSTPANESELGPPSSSACIITEDVDCNSELTTKDESDTTTIIPPITDEGRIRDAQFNINERDQTPAMKIDGQPESNVQHCTSGINVDDPAKKDSNLSDSIPQIDNESRRKAVVKDGDNEKCEESKNDALDTTKKVAQSEVAVMGIDGGSSCSNNEEQITTKSSLSMKIQYPERTTTRKNPLNADQLKMALYLEASKAHRGNGAERMFSNYWETLEKYITRQRVRSDSGGGVEASLKHFLITRKMKRIHNKLVLAIMAEAMRTDISTSCSAHIPQHWESKTFQASLDQLNQEDATQRDEILYRCQWDANFGLKSGTWTVCEDRLTLSQFDTSNTIQPALVGSIHSTDLVNDEVLPSARLPGALEIEPLVRKLTTNSGLIASDNAVWMLVVAIREHSSSLMRKIIANDKDLVNGYAPRVPNHFQTSLARQKDSIAHDGDDVKPSGKEKSERKVINSISLSHVLAENPSATSRLTSMYSDMAPDNRGSSSIPDLGNVNSIINSSIQRAAHWRQKCYPDDQSVVLAAAATSKSSTLVSQAGNNAGGVSQSNSVKSQSLTTTTTLPPNPLSLNQQPKFVTQQMNQLYPANIQPTTQPPQSLLASIPFQNNMQQIHPGPQQLHAGNYFSQSQVQSAQQFMLMQKMQQFHQEQQRFIPPTLPQAHLTLPPPNKQNLQQSHSAMLMSHTNHTPKSPGGTTNQQTRPTVTKLKAEPPLTKPGFPSLTNNNASKESEKQAPKTSSDLPIDPTQTSLAQDPKRVVSSSPPTRVIKRGSKNLASLTKPTPQPSPVNDKGNTSINNDEKTEPLDTKKDTETTQNNSDAKDLEPVVKPPSASPNSRSKRFGSKNLAALKARASFSDK